MLVAHRICECFTQGPSVCGRWSQHWGVNEENIATVAMVVVVVVVTVRGSTAMEMEGGIEI